MDNVRGSINSGMNLDENLNKKNQSKSTDELEEKKEDKEKKIIKNTYSYRSNSNDKNQINAFNSQNLNNLNNQNFNNNNFSNRNNLAEENDQVLLSSKKFPNEINQIYDKSFSPEMIEALENYFTTVKMNRNLKEKSVLFFDLYEKHNANKHFIFMLFWFPFINSDELLSVEILNTTKVFMGEKTIESIFTISISSKDLNNYAFNLAVENKFQESLLLIIIKQGKIKLPLEWLYEQIKNKSVNLLEDCWLAANDCFFETQKFSQKFFDFYKFSLNLSVISNDNKTLNFGKKLLGASIKKIDTNRNNFDSNNFMGALDKGVYSSGPVTNGFNPGMKKEYLELFSKNFGKLTISKLILSANLQIINSSSSVEKEAYQNLIRAVCIFDKEKKFSGDVLEGLFITKNKAIAAELLEANLLNIDISVFQTALYFQDLRFCLQFYERYSDFKIFDKESLHDEIIEKLLNDLNNMEVYLFFIKSFSNDFRLNTTKTLVKIIEDLLQVSNQSNKVMNNFSNPIKIFVLIAEILSRIKRKFPSLDSTIQRIIQKCLDYSENIQDLIEDDSVFRELLLERDLTKRSVLEIISQNNFLILLKNKLIEKIVDDLWNGPYDIQGSFFEVSSQYRSLTVNTDSKDYDIYTKQRLGLLSKKTKSFKSNFTHFKVWQRNIYTKYFVEILIGLLLIIFGQLISIFYINEYKEILEFDNSKLADYSQFLLSVRKNDLDKGKVFINNNKNLFYNSTMVEILELQNSNSTDYNPDLFEATLEAIIVHQSNSNSFDQNSNNGIYLSYKGKNITQMLQEYNINLDLIRNLLGSQSLFNSFYTKVSNMQMWMEYFNWLFWFYLLLPFDYFMRLIYTLKARKPNLGLTLFPDIGLILFGIVMKIITLDSNNIIENILTNLSYDSISDFNYLPYLKLLENFIQTDPFNYQLLALAIMCGFLWVRFILLIRGTKTFGPLIVIFLVSLKGVVKYVALFLLVTFAYSCCAYLVFYRIEGYYFKNPFYCFIYFFSLSLGGDLEYDSFSILSTEKPYIPFLGGIFIVTVLILNVIVFFNLIIALLSNIFETYKNYSLQLYIQKKLEIRKKYYDDEERFNSLLVSYFPFNILTFPLGFVLLFMSDKTKTKKINKLIMYINYSFYAFFYTFGFALLTFILLPFTFIKICYSKFVQIFVDEIQQYFKAYKVISFLFYIIFGMFFQLKSFSFDIVIFFKELWKKRIPLTTDAENIGKYSIKTQLLKIIVRMVKKTGKNNNLVANNNNNSNLNGNNSYNFAGNLSPSGQNLGQNLTLGNNSNFNKDNNNNKENNNGTDINTGLLKVSLEKFLFLLSKQLDPNADKKYKENLNIYDYNVEKETNQRNKFNPSNMPSGDLLDEDAESNRIALETGFNFNSNYLSYSPIFERQGYNYTDILDYLFNFCDEKYNIDIPTLINIVCTGLKVYEIRLFYANISDKNYNNYTAKKQQIFFGKIDTVMRKETQKILDRKKTTQKISNFAVKTLKTLKTVKTLKALKTVKSFKETEKEEKAYKENASQNATSNAVDFTESKNLYENNLKYLNNQASESNLINFNNANNNSNVYNDGKQGFLESKKTGLKGDIKRVFSKFFLGGKKPGEKNYLQKIEKSKNLFELPETLSIPLITRNCVVSFYNDLKEYQNDLSKKISENILKNQKYLEEIIKEKKNSNSDNKKHTTKDKQNKGLLGGFLNKQKEKMNIKINEKKAIELADNKIRNNNNKDLTYDINTVKTEEYKSKIFKDSIDPNKLENLDKAIYENFDNRISSLEEKMEKLIFMTERIFNSIEKKENSLISRDNSIDDNYGKADEVSNRSASTMKIEKFYGQMNFAEFDS